MATFNYTAGAGDCWGSQLGAFFATGAFLVFGDTASGGGANSNAWIPFAVNLTKGRVLVSATLKVIASASLSATTCKVRVGCEDADNPSTPSGYVDLLARTTTTAYVEDNNVAAWTAGTEYTFDVTAAVQEVLDRAGWAIGNTLAVILADNGSTDDVGRQIASSENTSYAEAILTVVTRYGGQVI